MVNTCKIEQITFILSLNDLKEEDLQLKRTYKTMGLLMDECGEVFSESEISARDEVIKFTERTKSNEEYSDNNVRKVIHELFSTYTDSIEIINLRNVDEMLKENIDPTENAHHYCNKELVRGA